MGFERPCSFRYALATSFTFRCDNWVDEDLPLYYSFRSQEIGAVTRVPVAGEQQTNRYTSTLPLGSRADNYTVLGWSDIADSFRAITDTSSACQVRPFDYIVSSEQNSTSEESSRRRLNEASWSLTAFLSNTSETGVREAVDASNPETCMRAISDVATILNAHNASNEVDSAARRDLRSSMLSSLLPQCVALMELTTTTATQRAATLSAIAYDGSELDTTAQQSVMKLVRVLSIAADNAGDGIDHHAALAIARCGMCDAFPRLVLLCQAYL